MAKGVSKVGSGALAALFVATSLAACGDDDSVEETLGATTTTVAVDEGEFVPTFENEIEPFAYPPKSEEPATAEARQALFADADLGAPAEGDVEIPRRLDRAEPYGGVEVGPEGAASSYKGMRSIFMYDNFAPGVDSNRSCGQAAAATVLADWGRVAKDPNGGPVTQLWNSYPPNVAFGAFGTGWDQMERMFQGNGMKTTWITGNAALEDSLRREVEVVVLLDVGTVTSQWGGHWVVVYGYDKSSYYVTNWSVPGYPYGKIPKSKFNQAWKGWIVQGAGVANRGLVAYL